MLETKEVVLLINSMDLIEILKLLELFIKDMVYHNIIVDVLCYSVIALSRKNITIIFNFAM